jgi:putative ABC transport system permease protein
MNDTLRRDLRVALRGLRQRAGFTTIAILTLAIGIGAVTAIFSVVNGVLLRPLPYEDPAALTWIRVRLKGNPTSALSAPEYWDLRDRQRSFERVGAFADGTVNLTGSGAPERLRSGYVTADVLPLLGVAPALGRGIADEDDLPGRPPVVLLSDGVWRRRFGADPAILGRTLILDDAPTTVIGVMPPGFQLPTHFTGVPMEAWLPLQLDAAADRSERGWHFLDVVARLRPGVTPAAAHDEVGSLMAAMLAQYPMEYNADFAGMATPLSEYILGDVRPAILVLLGAVGLLLIIACANVASLLLAQGEARHREIAVRFALGAERGQIVRQLLTESVVLSLAGGLLGLLVAMWGIRALILGAPPTIPRLDTVGLDGRVLAFTLLVSVGTGLLFGLAPAIHSSRTELAGAMVEGGRLGTTGAARQRFRRGLVVGQIALALVLLTGAGLLVQSFLRVRGVDPGFQPERLLTARIDLSPVRYATSAQRRAFYRDALTRIEAVPGVRSAGAARALPMTGQLVIGDWSFVEEGKHSNPPLPSEWTAADWQVVTPGYFRTMGMPIVRGRGIDAGDRLGAPGVVVINQTLARQVWPDADAVGRRLTLGGGTNDSIYRTVIGVVGDVRHRGLSADPRPEMYLPQEQFPAGTGTALGSLYLTIRSAGEPTALVPSIRAAVAELDPDVTVSEVQTMEQALGAWAAERRFTMLIVTGFALAALLLGAVGIYGIMAHLVVQRTREIGIRIALGAVPREILRLVLSQGAVLAGVGIVLGVAGAFAATRLLAGLLFHIRPTDPVTFAGTALLLALVAALASLVPAFRATRVAPVEALRAE